MTTAAPLRSAAHHPGRSGPAPFTERITMLVVTAAAEPTMIVPILERPAAEHAAGDTVRIVDSTDGSNPYAATARLLDLKGRYAVSDSAWSMHLLGLQE